MLWPLLRLAARTRREWLPATDRKANTASVVNFERIEPLQRPLHHFRSRAILISVHIPWIPWLGRRSSSDNIKEAPFLRLLPDRSARLWNTALGGTTSFAGYPLWVAEYTGNSSPRLPNGFADYVFWQYSESGSVPGIAGNADLDQFNGSRADLAYDYCRRAAIIQLTA